MCNIYLNPILAGRYTLFQVLAKYTWLLKESDWHAGTRVFSGLMVSQPTCQTIQGSHKHCKTWKNGKSSSIDGKVREFDNLMKKSGNFVKYPEDIDIPCNSTEEGVVGLP